MASSGKETPFLANVKPRYNGGLNLSLEQLEVTPWEPLCPLCLCGYIKLLKTPQAGFEPATNRLTADRSTAELLRITAVAF